MNMETMQAGFESWAGSRFTLTRAVHRADRYFWGETQNAWEAWQAALAATGKQQVGEVHVQGSDELRARTDSERAAYLEGREEGKAQAARQPVGQEPIAWRIVYPEGNRSQTWSDGSGLWPATDGALGLRFEYAYAAPPAQAVDLGPCDCHPETCCCMPVAKNESAERLANVRELLSRRLSQWRSHLPSDPAAPGIRMIRTVDARHGFEGEPDYNSDVSITRECCAVLDNALALIDGKAVQS